MSYFYDIDAVKMACDVYGYAYEFIGCDEIHIRLIDDIKLIVANNRKADDTYFGFYGSLWHRHGELCFENESGVYSEYSPKDIIEEYANGNIVILIYRINGVVTDIEMDHKCCPIDIKEYPKGTSILIQFSN